MKSYQFCAILSAVFWSGWLASRQLNMPLSMLAGGFTGLALMIYLHRKDK